ncbi:MAG: exosortase V [Sphingomonadales bacterium]
MATVAPVFADWPAAIRRHWLLVLAMVSVVVPTLYAMARGPWSLESGVHGPIVVATGLWLLFRRLPEMQADMAPGDGRLTALMLAVGVPFYIFGRAFDFISLEVFGLLLALLAVMHSFVGMAVLRRLWFPIMYMAFVIPLPGTLVDAVTQPLKIFVSEVVTGGLAQLGYPMGRTGVTLYVANYQLLVEDACSGMNSLVSLTAIGLFYVYMIRGSNLRYSLLLLTLVLPIAVAANCVRVAALVLITYYLGNAAAQGFLHNFAGMVTFVSALLIIFLIDGLLSPVRMALASAGRRPH